MESGTQNKRFSQLIRLFSQRTSIRGIPKLENSKYPAIKWFWGLFIVTAHIIMIILVAFLVLRYLQYDRINRTTSRKVELDDFPEITICSKLFFYGNQETTEPFVILDDYIRQIHSKFLVHMKNLDYSQANNLLYHELTTFSFFYKHLFFIQNRTNRLAAEYRRSCSINVLQDNFTFFAIPECTVRGVFHPSYVNCLAFSLPNRSVFNSSTNLEIVIDLGFAKKPKTAFVDRFKMDELYSFNMHDRSYKPTIVYLHKVSDYPFIFNFEVPFRCDQDNEYIVEMSQVTKADNNFRRDSKICTKNTLDFDSFGVTYSVTKEHFCRELRIQELAMDSCGCYIPYFPMRGVSGSTTVACIENHTLAKCFTKATELTHDVDDISCLPFCTRTYYTAKHIASPLHYSNFSKLIKKYVFNTSDCIDTHARFCKEMPGCILKEILGNHTDAKCFNDTNDKSKNSDCSKLRLRVNMKSMVTVETESLVVEITTLLSQISGICAFFTGLTFTFIAEVIEAIIIWRISMS